MTDNRSAEYHGVHGSKPHISRSDTKVSILINICNELDYDIIIRPRGGNDRVERTVVLDEVPDRKDNRGKYER